jgi:translation initiation factor IF-2
MVFICVRVSALGIFQLHPPQGLLMIKDKLGRERKDGEKGTLGRFPESTGPFKGRVARSLDMVLKADSAGSQEAVMTTITERPVNGVEIKVIHADVGAVAKSDLLMALTGSRLVVGFNVDVMPEIPQLSREQGVEVRLYKVIYRLSDDLHQIARSLIPMEEQEKLTGKARVIALFKSSRKDIILGCEVVEGRLSLGDPFRVISAMGQVYTGHIQSLHIETVAVKKATVGQQVGIKIPDFHRGRVGDWVECFETVRERGPEPWRPKGGVRSHD